MRLALPPLVLLFVAGAASAAQPAAVMRVHFLDVGQGAATLVELPCGAMLVDTGGEENDDFQSNVALQAYLDAFFARRADLGRTLDVLLLTHPHIDHVRGVEPVLTRYVVRNVVEGGRVPLQEDAIVAMEHLRAWLAARPEVGRLVVSADSLPPGGGASPVLDPFPTCKGVDPRVVALWGSLAGDPGWGEDDFGGSHFDDDNNHSVVTRIDFGASSVLIPGDLEVPAIRSMLHARDAAAIDVDIYQVGHHGSHNGTTAELVAAMSPEWAVMEVGPPDRRHSWTAWRFGHPRAEAVHLLEDGVSGARPSVPQQLGVAMRTFTSEDIDRAIYATGWDGTVVLEADAEGNIRRVAADAPAAEARP